MDSLSLFEGLARRTRSVHEGRDPREPRELHPFDGRNIFPDLPKVVRALFDDGHYPQATFEACKYLEKEVRRVSGKKVSGAKLMMQVFGGAPPGVVLTTLTGQSADDEQEGYKFLFAGAILGIRNPRGHEVTLSDDTETCLEHLVIVSHLLRRLHGVERR